MSGFSFKQFHLEHDNCAMKVGTDGILLGAWCDLAHRHQVLDIGCGCGLIALMAAQRSLDSVTIVGIDIDNDAAKQAHDNAQASPWKHRVKIEAISVQEFAVNNNGVFDYIISNPPFYPAGQMLKTIARATARHNLMLPAAQLIAALDLLLTPAGCAAFILPIVQAKEFISYAEEKGFHCKRLLKVKAKPEGEVFRYLFELQRQPCAMEMTCLAIRNTDGSYSEPYIKITQDFYLKMPDKK